VDSLADKLTAKGCDFVVEKLKYGNSLAHLKKLTDCADTFILAVCFPETNTATMRVADLAK
jgi:hypothetical protein